MSFPSKNLMAGETVIQQARIHGIVYLPAILLALLAAVACGFVPSADPDAKTALEALALALALFALGFAVRGGLRRGAARFAVTNKRVLIRLGLVRRRSLEILLNQIEGITVQQGLLGRMLGYGTVVIEGTGGDHDPFRLIARPEAFRLAVQEQIERHNQGFVAGPAVDRTLPGAPVDRYSELARLDELRRKGILTEDEFQTEKRRVLAS